MNRKVLGILVGGGPAPGINAVIGAATIEAINRGFEVYGLFDGFKWLTSSNFNASVHAMRLTIADVARIHFDGGSMLRIARNNVLDEASVKSGAGVKPDIQKVRQVIENLRSLGVDHLLTIGGDDTALSARFVSEGAGGNIRIVHVPKTIDNDLPLPADVPTFGFSTAVYEGTRLVKNLMLDSQTTGRWYLVTAMGRQSGWLAMWMGMSAGATVTLIPEEFDDHSKVCHIVDVIEGAILKRKAMGRSDGVAIIAEGLAYKLGDRAELERILGKSVPVDAAGHPRLADVPIGDLLRSEIESRFKQRGQSITLVTHESGYELRSADPTPFDMSYCRSLGYYAIRLFLSDNPRHRSGVMVSLVNGNLNPMHFSDMIDPVTNRTRVRRVDVRSDQYRVARAYMIRLERSDLDNEETLARIAAEAKMTPAEFRARYERAATRIVDGFPESA
ncbi:MAG: 6-phosphofructokinase [Phycisphaerales bacterium]|nr:6-phosphofructokinase [Phycisphaerales bacterium]